MPRSPLSRLVTAAAALAIAATTMFAPMACTSFGEDPGVGVEASTVGDGSASEANDADAAAADAGVGCLELAHGPNGFAPSGASPVPTFKADSGVTIEYPAGDDSAAWRRSFDVAPSATGLRLTVDGHVNVQGATTFDVGNGWYADIGKVIHGPDGTEGSSPGVNLVLSSFTKTAMGVYTNVYAAGTGAAGDGVTTRFAQISQSADFHIVLDLRWSKDDAKTNLDAQLGGSGVTPGTPGRTLTSASDTVTSWNVVLGGNAGKSHPPLSLVYTKVCFEAQ